MVIERVFIFCAALLLASPLDAQTDSKVQSEVHDWPRFLGSAFDGSVAAVDPRIDFDREPKFVWSIEVGDGYGIGSVKDDRYYQFDAAVSDRGEPLERLRCFNLADGKEIWSQTHRLDYRDMFGYEDGPRASPTLVDDRVITMGVTGLLTCRDLETGSQVWEVDTSAKYGVVQNFFGVGCSPLVLNGQVIVMVGGSPPEDHNFGPMQLNRVSSNGSAVVAFDLENGNELWKCGEDLASYSSPRPIELDGETLVLVFARTGLMAIDPVKGSVRWKIDHRADKLESVNAVVPVVQDDHVFISECYEVGSMLLKVNGESRQVVWQDPPGDRRRQSMRCHWSTPALVDGFLYGCSGRNEPDSDFRCVELETGEVQWIDPRRVRSSVTRVGAHLVVLEERGRMQIVKPDPDGLDVIARWDLRRSSGDRPALRSPCWAAPIVVGTKLITRGDRHVICLDLAH